MKELAKVFKQVALLLIKIFWSTSRKISKSINGTNYFKEKNFQIPVGVTAIFLFLCLCSFVSLLVSPSDSNLNNTQSQTKKSLKKETESEFIETEKAVPVSIPIKYYKIIDLVDANTITAEDNNQKINIRLLGITSPQSTECYGTEAIAKLKEQVLDKEVRLEADSIQQDKDAFGNLNRFVFLANGENINLNMIKAGASRVDKIEHKFRKDFESSADKAHESKTGLWGSPCTCEDKKGQEESRSCIACNKAKVALLEWNCSTTQTEVDDLSCSSLCPKPPAPPPATPGYTCNCSKTCPNMSCDEAQYQLNVCGCQKRDNDNDGIACDAQCQ